MTYLFLHGLGQTAASWDRVLKALPVGMDAVCPELSRLLEDGPCRYDRLYSALASRCDGIPGPVGLCGLSLGGILSMQYAMAAARWAGWPRRCCAAVSTPALRRASPT